MVNLPLFYSIFSIDIRLCLTILRCLFTRDINRSTSIKAKVMRHKCICYYIWNISFPTFDSTFYWLKRSLAWNVLLKIDLSYNLSLRCVGYYRKLIGTSIAWVLEIIQSFWPLTEEYILWFYRKQRSWDNLSDGKLNQTLASDFVLCDTVLSTPT